MPQVLLGLQLDEELDHAKAVAELAQLGVEAVPALFDAVAMGRYTVQDSEGEDHSVPLSYELGEAVVAALGRHPGSVLFGHLAERLAAEPTVKIRLAVVHLVGRLGHAAQLKLMLRAGAPTVAGKAIELPVARAVESGVQQILVREPSAMSRIRTLFSHAHPAVLPSLVRGVGTTRHEDAMVVLAELFDGEPHLDRLVLNQIGQLANHFAPPVDIRVLTAVRSQLASTDLGVKREAALTLGHIDDFEAVPKLIAFLEEEDKGLALNAYWALVAMSGLELRPEPQRWKSWHTEELAWWQTRAPDLFSILARGSPDEVTQAINEISSRRAYRHDLAQELALALDHPSPVVVKRACGALRQMGSRVALHALRVTLEHPDASVRESAWQALRAITGLDLPNEPLAWRAVS